MPDASKKQGLWNQVADFFGSLKLALVLLLALAAASIIGTVLPQGESLAFYEAHYTPNSYKLIHFFRLYDAYHSFWFLWLLLLLTVNLVVCSLRRLPAVWKVAKAAPRTVTERLFDTLPFHRILTFSSPIPEGRVRLTQLLGRRFGRPRPLPVPDGEAFYLERWRFSRFGVYLVHFSVLILLAGGITSSLYGFKGFLELVEGEKADRIYAQDGKSFQKLGFQVELKKFTMALYPDGTPKEYRSDLLFTDGDGKSLEAAVKVNHPFTHNGFTFYQSSWSRVPQSLRLRLENEQQRLEVALGMEERVPLPGTPYSLKVVRYIEDMARFGPALGLVLFDNQGHMDMGLILINHPEFHGNRIKDYRLRVLDLKTRYVSGLQVNRDPGIGFIWVGASLMLLGFLSTFYLSHRQIWVWFRERKDPADRLLTEVYIGATAHKHREAFFRILERSLQGIEGGRS
jgi:cytochrome c biogenesis protein